MNPRISGSTQANCPSIATLFRYLRDDLSPSEKEEVDKFIQANPEYVKILEGIQYRINKYGSQAERSLIYNSLATLKKIINGQVSGKTKSSRISSDLMKFEDYIHRLGIESIVVVSSGSLAIALTLPSSRGMFDNFGVISFVNGYLFIITHIILSRLNRLNVTYLVISEYISDIGYELQCNIKELGNKIIFWIDQIIFILNPHHMVNRLSKIKIPHRFR